MKFLCIPCDTPMKLAQAVPPDRGSVSLVYSCPECGYEFAMLTNPMETQVVGSLGVAVGPPTDSQATPQSKCPFSGMVREMTGSDPTTERGGFPWTDEARRRLQTIPEFVRPVAKSGIERYAQERGYSRVDDGVLDEAKQFFGM